MLLVGVKNCAKGKGIHDLDLHIYRPLKTILPYLPYHTVYFMSYSLCIVVWYTSRPSKPGISEQQGKNSCLPNVLHTCTSAPLEMLPVSLVSSRHLHERPCLEVTGKTEHSPVSPTKREIAGYFCMDHAKCCRKTHHP